MPKKQTFSFPIEIFTNFNGIKFYDNIHKYYLGDKNLTSVTTILHKFQEEFDIYYWANRKKDELNMTLEEVIDYWKALNLKSQIKGSAIHNYAELLYNNKIYEYDDELVNQKLGNKYLNVLNKVGEKSIKYEYDIVKNYVDNFYNDTQGKLIPIKTEYIVFDENWLIAGMLDVLFWNVKKNCFQIWDYKTNKQIRMISDYNKKLKQPFSEFDDCEYNMYCLQLSLYKKIIERNTPIKINGMYLVWLNECNDNYKIINVNDLSFNIDMLFEFKKV